MGEKTFAVCCGIAGGVIAEFFGGCTSLVGGAGTTYNKDYKDKTYARIDGGASNPGYFTAKAVTPYLTIYMWKRTA